MSLYADWGLTPIINASGAVTRLGGAPMPPAVVDAFRAAAQECVPLDTLQGLASREIALHTGAEAGCITSGAAAALLLGTAAILTGDNLGRMERLPDCTGFPNEFVVAREHRNGYDHAVRAAGARFVDVGFHEPIAGAGVRRVEAWEYADACGPQTAGIFYVQQAGSQPLLEEVVAVARQKGLPVLVDAAGQLPPRSNLRDILTTGADLVCFSGGKAIRGPQATGLLCGRRDLIAAAAVQMLDMDDYFSLWNPPPELIDKSKFRGLPRHGIGRALKVSKEQIMAVLTALRLFASGAYDAELAQQHCWLEQIAATLAGHPVQCRLVRPADPHSLPSLEITVDETRLGRTAFEVCRSLRNGTPGVYVGHWGLEQHQLIVNPLHLNDSDAEILAQRLADELRLPTGN
ncbi:MAG: aminotransferase class V-fold PLP-dependent enzyme [Planctomycetota bacterium]